MTRNDRTVATMEHRGDSGQSSVLLLACIALIALAGVGVGEMGQRLAAHGRARTAADTAALAGVTGGQAAAASLAQRNGAQLVSFASAGDVVTVVVSVEGQQATARASDGP